ncbi:hypothetical protein HK100_005775 [Physocladia obscura]|uniref:HECT domain-containing protein n=1 Tax=Physocladia obscura TaxID=109957 RepID=A0AAD5XD15_9FUNG|nr:hypothetical protein HK100_005775 [Physocladia obscura]
MLTDAHRDPAYAGSGSVFPLPLTASMTDAVQNSTFDIDYQTHISTEESKPDFTFPNKTEIIVNLHEHDATWLTSACGSDIYAVSFGVSHGCAVVSDGSLFTWGDNNNGQLGHSKNPKLPSRVDALDVFNIKSVSCGERFTVVLTTCGKVLSFGSNYRNSLGHSFDCSRVQKPKFVKFNQSSHINDIPNPKISMVASGLRHTLLLSEDGCVWGFGDNSVGQLALESNERLASSGAALIAELFGLPICKIACGNNFSMALTSSGNVYSWGSNESGQLGLGTKTSLHSPTLIKTLSGIVNISLGASHCAAIDFNGNCFLWGDGSFGQIAFVGVSSAIPIPLKTMDGCDFGATKSVFCGRNYTFVIAEKFAGDGTDRKDVKVYSFGSNEYGQLASGDLVNRNSPSLVNFPICLEIEKYHTIFCGLGDQVLLISDNRDVFKSISRANDGLSLTEVKLLVSSIEKDGSNVSGEILLSKLQKTWFSLSRLNGCFVTTDGAKIGDLNIGISLSDAKAALKLMFKMKNQKWAPPIHKILSDVFPSHNIRPSASVLLNSSPEALRGILILFENQLLVKDKENLLGIDRLVTIINGLTDEQKFVLEKWWIVNPSLRENFRTAVSILNKALTLYTQKRLEAPTVNTLNVLKWLWTINNRPYDDKDPLQFRYSEKTSWNEPSSVPSSDVSQSLAHIPHLTPGAHPTMTDIANFATSMFTQHMEAAFKSAPEITLGDRPSPKTLIPHSEFVNEVLSKRVDFKNDFLQLCANTRPSFMFGPSVQNPENTNIFAFCKFSFSFTLGARTLLLALDSQRQQMESQTFSLIRHLRSSSPIVNNGREPINNSDGSLAERTRIRHSPPRPETIFNLIALRRNHLLHDTFKAISKMNVQDLKKPLKVKFEHEIGVDGGGVSREFMNLFFQALLKHSDMFEDAETGVSQYIWFNPLSTRSVKAFRTAGRILGIALFNGYITYVPFPLVLFKRLLGWPATLDDLAALKPSIAKWLKTMEEHENPETFEDLFDGFEFSVTVRARKVDDKSVDVEPYKTIGLPGKYSKQAVTFENRHEYVKAMIQWHTGGNVEAMLTEFRKGFLECCGGPVLDQLLPEQLEVLIKGKDLRQANFRDLETVAVYKEPYHKNHPVILRFWSVFHALPVEFKHKFLKFMTGSDSIPPIRGLKEIRIEIQPSGLSTKSPTAENLTVSSVTQEQETEGQQRSQELFQSTQLSQSTQISQSTDQLLPAEQQPQQRSSASSSRFAALASLFLPSSGSHAIAEATPAVIPNPSNAEGRSMISSFLDSLFGMRARSSSNQPVADQPAGGPSGVNDISDSDGEQNFEHLENHQEQLFDAAFASFVGESSPEFDDNDDDDDLPHFEDFEHITQPAAVVGSSSDSTAIAVESQQENWSSSELTRGVKRARDEDDQNEDDEDIDGWNQADMDVVVSEQYPTAKTEPVSKKIRNGKSPVGLSEEAKDLLDNNWKLSVPIDVSLNEIGADYSNDEQRLPVAHTCTFVLDLPPYRTVEMLLNRLIYAVENSGEFHLV